LKTAGDAIEQQLLITT